MPTDEIPLRGMHNVENTMAAAAIARLAGATHAADPRRRHELSRSRASPRICPPHQRRRLVQRLESHQRRRDAQGHRRVRRRPLDHPRRQRQEQRLHAAAPSSQGQSSRCAADRRGRGKDRGAIERSGLERSLRDPRRRDSHRLRTRARPATRCCWRPPARASISSKISSIAGANSNDWCRSSHGQAENRLDSVSHHSRDGRLRAGDAVQRIQRRRGAALRRPAVSFRGPPDSVGHRCRSSC